MSSPTYAPPVPVPVGDIQFYDNFLPILDPGEYTINLTQAIPATTGKLPADFPTDPFTASPTFTVLGGGLSFGSGQVYSVYPPDTSAGVYDTVLPNVVLAVRTLPWEVPLDVNQDPTVPWMALLLFAPDELQVPAGQSVSAPLVPLSQAQAGGNGVLPVTPPPGEVAGDPTVRIIEVPTGTFTKLVPYTPKAAGSGSISELQFLAHCREVNTGNQEMMGMNTGDAWFSVVVGNRFPKLPTGSPPVIFTAHLVSLYSLEAYLNGAPQWPQGITAVRLISLYTWSFTCDPDQGASFETLMTNVANGMNWLSLPVPVPATLLSDVAATVQTILQEGYAPVGWTTRMGDQITSWYRGPLCPSQAPRLLLNPIHNAAEAMIFDAPLPGSTAPASGLFDQSYAVAWETGRLLALADKSFSASLMKWRKRAQVILNQINATPSLTNALSNPADVQELRNLLDTQILEGSYQGTKFLNTLLNDFAQQVAPGVTMPANVPLPPAAAAPSAAPPDTAALSAVLGNATVQEAFTDMYSDQFESICEWLANLALLQGVPFANLVADPRMLPPESLRFFYLDQTYTDVMIDGALSAGIQTSFDVTFNDLMRDVIRDAIDATITQIRTALLTGAGEPQTVSGAMAGFLLRSSVVSGFPGLQVIGHAGRLTDPVTEGTPVVPILRMVSLAPGVLFCLFSGVPDWVEITMPHAGLRFGTEDNGDIALRFISGAQPGAQPAGDPAVKAHYRTGTTAAQVVLDLQATVPAIPMPTIDPSRAATTLTPASFAIQMIDAPERAIFVLPVQPSSPSTKQEEI